MSDFLIQLLLSGIITGSVYGLIALGFTLIYNSTSVLNFAQGEFVMIGAVFSAILITNHQVPYFVAVILVVIVAVLVGFFVELVGLRFLQKKNASHMIMVLSTLAMAIIISNMTRLLVGTSQMYTPPVVDGNISLGRMAITGQEVVIIGFLLITVFGLWFFLNKTMYGKAMKATGIDKVAAQLMGVNINTVILISFGLSAALAAVGGILIAPLLSASAQMGLPLAVKGFIAAVIGGMSNPFAGIIGGLLIGILEAFISGYISSSLVEVIVFILLPIILLFRPNGLLSRVR